MNISMTPATYVALCGLVLDAMQKDSDAAPLLKQAAAELAAAISGQLPAELASNARMVEALERTGWRDAA
ncbi:MAG: hypothetical protein EBZ69_01625 [Alphaproteobacteria bacterium]|nr:hypothetical protein [Alphaproteobacteria bacterium]NDC55511.1 hypothetical protein [Alphaproteobacteria bacterium]NDG04384.1 hypothetical protein [Alphaproteobacteria bacterium]